MLRNVHSRCQFGKLRRGEISVEDGEGRRRPAVDDDEL